MVNCCRWRKPGRVLCNLLLVARVAESGVAVADAILAAQKSAVAVRVTRVEPKSEDVVPAIHAVLRLGAVDATRARRKSVPATLATPVRQKAPAVAAIRVTPVQVVAVDPSRLNVSFHVW